MMHNLKEIEPMLPHVFCLHHEESFVGFRISILLQSLNNHLFKRPNQFDKISIRILHEHKM